MEQSHDRHRLLGLGGAIGLHALAIALLLQLAQRQVDVARDPGTALVVVPLTKPRSSPSPPPDDAEAGEAGPPSRGETDAPAPPVPPAPLASPTPAEVSVDPGSAIAGGLGAERSTGAGHGGEGSGRGAGSAGQGSGSGQTVPPVRVAGALTHADYRRARPPRGAAGTVFVSYLVRADGAVGACTVLRSSGFEVFDRMTCRLIRERFRFRPARDAAGRPVEWEIRDDYTWTPA